MIGQIIAAALSAGRGIGKAVQNRDKKRPGKTAAEILSNILAPGISGEIIEGARKFSDNKQNKKEYINKKLQETQAPEDEEMEIQTEKQEEPEKILDEEEEKTKKMKMRY
jgi:predicted FMN-binding regulatory protein PaiB